MSRWLQRFRSLAGRNDGGQAYAAERLRVQAATAAEGDASRFAADMRAQSGPGARSLCVGTSIRDPSLRVAIPVADLLRPMHALVTGASGSGKTFAVVQLVRALLREVILGRESAGVVAIDPKSEFVPLLRRALADVLSSVPELAEQALSRLVVINPFATDALVPFGVLGRERDVDPEVTAVDVASLVSRMGGADLGVRQDALVYHLVLLGVDRRMTLPQLAELLGSPGALAREAALSGQPTVRSYFSNGAPLARGSLDGVQSRLLRLLRLRSSRLMLGAEQAIDFRQLLASRIILVDTGSPPLGSEDIARFWTGLVMLKLTRGIFERTPEDARRRVLVFIDEWAEALHAMGGIGDDYERVLNMARSRGVGFWLISQTLASAARVSPTLARTVATNTTLQWLFRMAPEDASSFRHALPLTGRRRRAPGAPWEEPHRSPFLAREEERATLEEELTRLPQRTFRFWHRERAYGAELVRASELRLPEIRDVGLAAQLERGTLARPIAELERAPRADDRTAFRPREEAAPDRPPPRAPRRGTRCG